MEHKNTALAPAVMEIINQVSGTYSAPFWDGLLAVTESLDTVRAAKDAIEALHGEKKDAEAYRLILALHDLASIEVPMAIIELEPYPEGVEQFRIRKRGGTRNETGKFQRYGIQVPKEENKAGRISGNHG